MDDSCLANADGDFLIVPQLVSCPLLLRLLDLPAGGSSSLAMPVTALLSTMLASCLALVVHPEKCSA